MQICAELVDDRLGAAFSRWYPGFTEENQLYRVALRPHQLNHSHCLAGLSARFARPSQLRPRSLQLCGNRGNGAIDRPDKC